MKKSNKSKTPKVETQYIKFGKAIRAARKSQNLSQEEVAGLVKRSRPSVVNIELGRQRTLLADVMVFAKALKLNPEDLFRASL